MRIQIAMPRREQSQKHVPVPARGAAQLVVALVVLRDALSIAAESDATDLFSRLKKGPVMIDWDAESWLRAAGVTFLHNGARRPMQWQDALLVEALLQSEPNLDDLELSILREGSLRGVFRGLFGPLKKRFTPAARASSMLVPGSVNGGFASSIEELLPKDKRPREVAAGLCALSAERFRVSYAVLRATKVVVTDRDDTAPQSPRGSPALRPSPVTNRPAGGRRGAPGGEARA